MNAIKRLVLVFFCLLTACAPPRPAEELPINKIIPLEKRKAQIKIISSWNIHGAMAAKNKTRGWSATMNWVQSGPSDYQIRLMGPLGSGSVLISRKGGEITIQDGPKTATSSNVDELLQKQTGIQLPVNNLYYWVRGLPAPGEVQSEEHDQYSHLVTLKQSG